MLNAGNNYLNIGKTNLGAATNVSAAALVNTNGGIIQLFRNNSNATQAALNVAGAAGFGAAGQVTGIATLAGDALVELGSESLYFRLASGEGY
ncbi:MAG: hypothetical protein ABI386_12630 [Rhodanobacter sp.]